MPLPRGRNLREFLRRSAPVDSSSLLEILKGLVSDVLKDLRRIPYRLAMRIRPDFPGVYIIFDQAGSVVYVGKSIEIASRLRNHLKKGNLIDRVLVERGQDPFVEGHHKCVCGRKVPCGFLRTKNPIADEISNEISSSWTVSVVPSTKQEVSKMKPVIETFIQVAMGVKYGLNWIDD